MFVVVWEPSNGHGGGHQVALTRDRAEAIHRALVRALPEGASCRIEAVAGYVPPDDVEQRQERRPDRRLASRRG